MVNVCQTCGDEGFLEALVFCDNCKIEAVHRYCLDITPVPLLDYITWFCEDCDGSDNGFDCDEVDQIAKLKHIIQKNEREQKKKKKRRRRRRKSAAMTNRWFYLMGMPWMLNL